MDKRDKRSPSASLAVSLILEFITESGRGGETIESGLGNWRHKHSCNSRQLVIDQLSVLHCTLQFQVFHDFLYSTTKVDGLRGQKWVVQRCGSPRIPGFRSEKEDQQLCNQVFKLNFQTLSVKIIQTQEGKPPRGGTIQ